MNTRRTILSACVGVSALLPAAGALAQDKPPEYWDNFKPSWLLNEPHAIRPQPRVGTANNAAVAYFEAWDMLPRKEWVRINELAGNRPGEGKPLPRDLREELVKQQAYVDALIRVSSMEHCDWGYAWESGWELLLPHLGYCRGSARVLAADATRCAQAGSPIAAAERLRAMVNISQHAAEGPILISSLVGVSICSLSITVAEEMLDAHQLAPAQARVLLKTFRSIPRADLYHTGASLAKEREVSIGWIRAKCPGREPGTQWVRMTAQLEWGFNFAELPAQLIGGLNRDQFDRDLARCDRLFEELQKAWMSDNPAPRLLELGYEVGEFQWGLLAVQMAPSYHHARASVTQLERSLTRVERRLEQLASSPNDQQSPVPPTPQEPKEHKPAG